VSFLLLYNREGHRRKASVTLDLNNHMQLEIVPAAVVQLLLARLYTDASSSDELSTTNQYQLIPTIMTFVYALKFSDVRRDRRQPDATRDVALQRSYRD